MLDSSERDILGQARIDDAWNLITTFSGMPRWRPEDVNKAGDLIAERLKALGLPVTVHRPKLFLSVPHDASVELDGEKFRAKAPSSSLNCPEGQVGELVYLPAQKSSLRSYNKKAAAFFGDQVGTPDEMRARFGGKILLTEGFGNPALTAIAEEWGAVGVIAMNPGVDIHWGTCTTIWGSPDLDDIDRKPKIPVVSVNKETGQKLIEVAGRGGQATIRTEMQVGWFEQAIPVVEIPGAEEPEKFVLLHGHYDSWDVGVGDNATGDATMLEIARVLWANRDKMRRSVRIAWWPGHSTGRYAGSTWFADTFAIDLDENCVAQVNCDSPGCRWATSYHQTSAFAETHALVRDVVEHVADQTPVFQRPHQAGDYSFNNIGMSSFFMLSSTMPDDLREEKGYYAVSGCGGNIAWHTENDTLDIADKDVLKTDIDIYLLSIWRVATEPFLPFDWLALMPELADTAKSYQKAAGDLIDLGPVSDEISKLTAALKNFYLQVDGGKIDPADANEKIVKLARILVPMNYTRSPRFGHDPAITRHPLPEIELVTEFNLYQGDELGFAQTQALRGRNKTVAALRAAQEVLF